jgi:hypothetical protein
VTDKPLPTPDTDGEVPYHETSSPEFADRAVVTFGLADDRGGMILTGPCPRCQHDMSWWIADSGFRTVTQVDDSTRGTHAATNDGGDGEDDGEEEPMICRCTVLHPSTPSGKKGCGAGWKLLVSRRP